MSFGVGRRVAADRSRWPAPAPRALCADYACTKSAMMNGLLLSLKNEIVKIAPRGRVNCVAPGWVRTPMADRAMQDPSLLYQALATYVAPVPVALCW